MDEKDVPASLVDLEERLRKVRERGGAGGSNKETQESDGLPRSVLGLAYRIGTEIVAALIVGVGSGILLDRWLGTQPWGLIVLFFLGAGAGVANVYRAVGGLGYGPLRPPGQTPEEADEKEQDAARRRAQRPHQTGSDAHSDGRDVNRDH